MARAMARLGDQRGVNHYERALHGSDSLAAAKAARALGEIGTDKAIQILFWFAAQPPAPPAYHNVSQALDALAEAGPAVFEALEPQLDHPDRTVRLLLVQVVGRSGHPDVLSFLERAARDADPDVQHAALDAIAELNTADAVVALRGLADSVPREWLLRALAAITQPSALEYLRTLQPQTTILYGELLEDDRKPLPGAAIQVVREHFFGEKAGWGWIPISARAETGPAGDFALAVLDAQQNSIPRLKVTTRASAEYPESASFVGEIDLASGVDNRVRVRIDRFFSRLVIHARRAERQD
jgi:hypothetical protein